MAKKETLIEAQAEQEGVVSAAKLEEWKAEYGHIYRTVVGPTAVIWRKLRRKEYVQTMTEQSGTPETKIFDRQDAICRACVLFPANIDDLIDENGGLSGTIADEILLKSGFDISDTEEL